MQELWIEQIRNKIRSIEILKSTMSVLQSDIDKIVSNGLMQIVDDTYQDSRDAQKKREGQKILDILLSKTRPISPVFERERREMTYFATINEDE